MGFLNPVITQHSGIISAYDEESFFTTLWLMLIIAGPGPSILIISQ